MDELAAAQARIAVLEAQVASLMACAEAGTETPSQKPSAGPSDPPRGKAPWTRRALILGAVAAAAAATDVVASPGSAHAAAGDPLTLGEVNSSDDVATWLGSSSTFNTLVVSNSAAGGADGAPQALVGLTQAGTGVLGTTTSGIGLRGAATTGTGLVAQSNSGPHLRLPPGNLSGPPASGTWAAGSIIATSTGALWACVTGGTPGNWRMIASGDSAGAFSPIAPTRVYDSRAPLPSAGQALGPTTDRVISVRNGRDLQTGAITVANLVPPGTSAITANITVTGTIGSGFISLAPGNASQITSSAINWWADGQTIANGLTLAINAAASEVKAFCRVGTAHLIIDVTGYFRATNTSFG